MAFWNSEPGTQHQDMSGLKEERGLAASVLHTQAQAYSNVWTHIGRCLPAYTYIYVHTHKHAHTCLCNPSG